MELAKEVVLARNKAGLNPPSPAEGGLGPRAAFPFEAETLRCAAAHSDDARRCEGQLNAVQIIDRTGASVDGCVLHGAVLLASLEGGRVVPLNGPDGAAIEAFRRAQVMPPFDFLSDRGVAVTATTAVDATDSPTLATNSGLDMDACSCWSGAGNARSSCSKEIMESRSREIA
jgi:hypothetical protein